MPKPPKPNSPEDRIARALAEEDMLSDKPVHRTEPTLLEMIEESIAATEESLNQLRHTRNFLTEHKEEDLPKIVEGSLRNMIVPMWRNSYQFNRQ